MSRVLIVDDDPDFVEAVRLHLERAGHAVASADNRSDGMRIAREGEIDLLILDVMMDEPDDGIVMAQELRRTGFDKPVLMMSGISRVTGLAYDKDAEIIPAAEFLEKPVRPETLIEKVNALLDQ
jgi:DNA-binding response OmpR family regulator